jgi:ATP-binding cassette, subfamily B, bacterial
MDCGPACLSMVASHYGKNYPLQYLRDNCFLTREGVSLLGISEAAQKIGLDPFPAKATIEVLLKQENLLPCILHWNQVHFVVLSKVRSKIKYLPFLSEKWTIADPGHGIVKLSRDKLVKSWLSEGGEGVALFLAPSETFYKLQEPETTKFSIKYLYRYLTPFKNDIIKILLLLTVASFLNLIFPFLTKNLIDKGVNAKNVGVITAILIAQLGLFLGGITIDVIRNYLMLKIGTKVSINVISDYLKKLLLLPIRFFDSKMTGDFNQRIRDNERIEAFLTSQSLLTFFSTFTFLVFFGILCYYDYKILLLYVTLTTLSIVWSLFWLKKRRILDYFRFQQRADNQDSINEIIFGVTEMKLNQFEKLKLKQWEDIQKKLFEINTRILKIDQLQLSGFEFLNQLKNILITFMVAMYVVSNKMTLGELLSVTYIIGQMNSPISQLISFFRSLQDAKMSVERLNEVEEHIPEETDYLISINPTNDSAIKNESGIELKNVNFQYEGPQSPLVLNNINIFIPEGKVTAIVGASGSGKTTLMRLLLKFYQPSSGDILMNTQNLENISPRSLRENCGVVMQDGYIFADTIERNIATGEENIDFNKLAKAVKIANIEEFINKLPLKYHTKIGSSGSGISGGQRQRILIARAVYKNPHYIFFDEATSALDAENERVIHDNLQEFFKGRTVLIIAHRLSTVKNADQIIVLKEGQIVEIGNHLQLVSNKADYFNLVKNQLELGN